MKGIQGWRCSPCRVAEKRGLVYRGHRIYASDHLVAGSDVWRLFERGDAFADFFERDHAELFHSQRDGDLADFVRAGPLNDEPADVVGHAHGFNDGQASGVTGIFAPIATATAKQSGPLEKAGVDTQVFKHLGRIRERLLANRADPAHEAL